MTGCYPYLGIHQDSTVNTYVVGILLYKLLPPCSLDIVLELYAKRTEVPRIGKTAIDIGTGIYESSYLGKGYDLFHCLLNRHSPHLTPRRMTRLQPLHPRTRHLLPARSHAGYFEGTVVRKTPQRWRRFVWKCLPLLLKIT